MAAVIGAAGEIIAEECFGMTKAKKGKKSIDGVWKGGARTVQVKTWSEARILRYKLGTFFPVTPGASDDLLVLLVRNRKPAFDVLYNGPEAGVGYLEASAKYGERRIVRLDAMLAKDDASRLVSDLA